MAKNVEIMKWVSSEKTWKKVSNLQVVLTEETANLTAVTKLVSDKAFEWRFHCLN